MVPDTDTGDAELERRLLGLVSPGEQRVHIAQAEGRPLYVVEDSRWQIVRSGEAVVWGIGSLTLNFAEFLDRHYELTVGEYVPPEEYEGFRFTLKTADGQSVGFGDGVVSHKMVREASPDIRAVADDDDEDGERIGNVSLNWPGSQP